MANKPKQHKGEWKTISFLATQEEYDLLEEKCKKHNRSRNNLFRTYIMSKLGELIP